MEGQPYSGTPVGFMVHPLKIHQNGLSIRTIWDSNGYSGDFWILKLAYLHAQLENLRNVKHAEWEAFFSRYLEASKKN